MDPFQEQLNSVWLLSTEDTKGFGGALCYKGDGHLVTARHVVDDIEDSHLIKGRRCDSAEWYDIEYLFDYPTLDLAILKVKTSDNSLKFPFSSLGDEIQLVPDEPLVCHGHGAAIPFSSRFGKTNYPYQPCNDLSTRLHNLELTLEGTDDAELAIIKRGIPAPPFKTLAGVLDKKEARKVKQMHPFLPLIELDEKCLSGFSGCPVFRVANADVVGIFSFSHAGCGYIVPAQVILYAIQQLAGLTI